MSNLLTRSLSGIVYVALIIAAIFFIPLGSYYLAMVFGVLGFIEWQRFEVLPKSGLYTFLCSFILILLLASVFPSSPSSLRAIFAFTALIGTFFLCFHSIFTQAEELKLKTLYRNVFGLVYLAPALLSLAELGKQPWILCGVFIMIWSFDSFAYLSGKYLGRHKMSPTISPNKTWEGFFGGAIFAGLAAYLLFRYSGNEDLALTQWLLLSILIVVSATLGDLLESALKRSYGLKDSGKLMPGHGGILDRIDSLLVAMPVTFLFLKIIATINP